MAARAAWSKGARRKSRRGVPGLVVGRTHQCCDRVNPCPVRRVCHRSGGTRDTVSWGSVVGNPSGAGSTDLVLRMRAETGGVQGPGCCRLCYYRRYRSLRFFGGLREAVLRRDRFRCRACGSNARLVVHHRSEDNQKRRLITLWIGCHTRVHRWGALRRWVAQVLLKLWRERHRHQPVQLQLPFIIKPSGKSPSTLSVEWQSKTESTGRDFCARIVAMTITWGARIIAGAAAPAPSTGTFK
jgi:hypothetical protein